MPEVRLGDGVAAILDASATQTVVAVDRAGEASGVSLSIVIGMAGLGSAWSHP